MNSPIREIVDILKKYYGYDYGKMIKVLREMLKVCRSFQKYERNPEKYKGKCPKEI